MLGDRHTETEYTVKGLQAGKEYEFRVAASNKAGTGKWSQTDAPIEARPPDCSPKPLGFVGGYKEIVVKAGELLHITVPYQSSPKPTCFWSKVGEELKESERLKFLQTNEEAEIEIVKAQIKDAGTYNCHLKNQVGQERVSIKVIVLDSPEQPQGPLEVSDVKADSCVLSWNPPKADGGTPITNYIIEKLDPKTNEWQKVNSYCKVPFYEVIGLDEGKPYKFRVSAENAQGVSVPLETEKHVVPKNPFSLPDAPNGLKAVSQTFETLSLEWNPPNHDGGSKILGYAVEINEEGTDDWFPVNENLIKHPAYTVENLKPGVRYNFKVKAKNAMGWSPVCREEVTVTLKPEFVKPDAPGIPEIKRVGKRFAELAWPAPPRDGGSKITGYVVEKRQFGADYWTKAMPYLVPDTNCLVNDLIDNTEYEFRVKAVNKAGESEPSSITGKVKITEFPDGVKPEFTKRLADQEGAIGGNVSFKAEFDGKPAPQAKWYKNGVEISPNNRFEIISEQFSSILTIKNLTNTDNNHIIACVAINPLGKETSEAFLKIIAVPKIEKEPGDQSVSLGETLKIKIPVVGKGPFTLKLNKEPTGDDDETPLDETKFTLTESEGMVTLTLPNVAKEDAGKYTIGISNESGTLEVPFRLKVKAPPSAPQGPLEVSDIGKTNCTLYWRSPVEDGGSRVTHYLIEKKEAGKPNWVPHADHCRDTFITLQGLNENTEYEFRVLAVNQNGASEPLTTTQSFVIKLPFGKPDAPGEPEVNEIGNNFVTLTWTRPASDGGGMIRGYWVEKKEKDSDRWIKVNLQPIQCCQCNVPNLIESKEYEFRVFAENDAGLSEPSTASKSVKVKDPHVATIPEFTLKLEDQEVNENKTAYFECSINAQPAPIIRFYKGSKELFDSSKYKITNEGDKFVLAIYACNLDDVDEYSVKAVNKGGSRMSRANLNVRAAPKIKLPERYKTTVMFEKDEEITIKLPYTANPTPTAKWFKNNEEIKPNESSPYKVEISNYNVTLKIKKASNSLSGTYQLTLSNPLGSDTCEIKIQIAGKSLNTV